MRQTFYCSKYICLDVAQCQSLPEMNTNKDLLFEYHVLSKKITYYTHMTNKNTV